MEGEGCGGAEGGISVFGEAFSKQDMSATATGVMEQTLCNQALIEDHEDRKGGNTEGSGGKSGEGWERKYMEEK